MDNQEVAEAIAQICEEKNISYESVLETIEAALAVAFRKDYGERGQTFKVNFDPGKGNMEIFLVKKIVEKPQSEEAAEPAEVGAVSGPEVEEEPQEPLAEIAKKRPVTLIQIPEEVKAAARAAAEASAQEAAIAAATAGVNRARPEVVEAKKRRFNPKTEIVIDEAKAFDDRAALSDEIHIQMEVPTDYGRMAAQTAKQVVIQKLREAERQAIFEEYKDKQGLIVTGTIHRVEGSMVFVDLGHATAVLPPPEQIGREHLHPNQKVKVYIVGVNATNKGPEIVVSRSHPDMVRRLFETEVPEIDSGAIEIKGIAREAGSRTKIAVKSLEENIDPIGSCVGQRGTRVQTIINEIGGEKIDIVEFDDDPMTYITHALAPAKILTVRLDEAQHLASAEVKEDQLSLAIGKGGQNVRLAARLTGWRIDIVKEGQPATEPKTAPESSAAPEVAPDASQTEAGEAGGADDAAPETPAKGGDDQKTE